MAILASLPESQILQALSSAGVNVDYSPEGGGIDDMAAGDGGGNTMQSWQATMAPELGTPTPKGPIYSGPSFIKKKAQPGVIESPQYGMAPDDGSNLDWLAMQQSGGMA